ncbi:MAG TPA: hypothetical protein VF119_05830 [Candidatus Limnocylindrales bacterium]
MSVDRCRQTSSIVERALDGASTERDREHARGCAACAAALRRLPAFERELGATARSLAIEPLPVALLASGAESAPQRDRAGRSTRAIGSVAFAAVLLVVAVIGVGWFARFEGGIGAPRALIRPEASIVADLAELGISCRPSIIDAKASPQRRGSVCSPAVARAGIEFLAVVERDAAGDPIAVIAKSTVEPVAGEAGRSRVADLIVEIAGTAFPDAADAAAAEAWVRSVLPVGDEVVHETTSIGGLDLTFEVTGSGHPFLQVAVPKP